MVHTIWVILWKDLLIRRNHYIATVLEFLLPVGLIILANLTIPQLPQEVNNNPLSFDAFKSGQCGQYRHGNIIYEPSNPFTDELMLRTACHAGYKKSSVKYGKLNDNSTYFNIGVKFEEAEDTSKRIPDFLNYTLYPTNKAWANIFTLWRFSGFAVSYNALPMQSVLEFQRAIDVSYLYLRNITAPKIEMENTDLFSRNPSVYSFAVHTSLFLAFCLMVPPIISRIVLEKFTGAKELMLMMGVERWQLWAAKFMDSFLFLLIIVSAMVTFLYVPLKEDSNVLKIPPMVFWGVVMYGLIGVICFLFFLSCFFEKATLCVYVTEIIWCFLFVLNGLMSALIEVPRFIKYLMCLFPHVTLMNGISVLLDFEFYGKKVKLTEKLSGKEDYLSLLEILSIMFFNVLLYLTFTWYLEQVKPGKYGVPQPYGFCFKRSYWFPSKVETITRTSCDNDNAVDGFECVPNNLNAGVCIQNMTKVYKSLDKAPLTAVDNISLNFYHGEISALLGHNGAGKTTVFSVITGMTYPTCGKIFINNNDLAVNICEARKSLGLCPQQNMLFNDLTVLQILKFYGVIKGLNLSKANKEAIELVHKLKLNNVKNTQTLNLSGGQKRKVSLAIALIGGSEVLVLDEPTSGMDPEIRREIWEILLNFRGSRTILLTTHFMEEADALCDRIAIMDHGKIKCYGSPMYLKSKFGTGYVLSVVIVDAATINDLTRFIKEHIPTAKFKSQNIRILIYELPESEVANFPELFSGLDEKQSKNEIISYSISLSTLEDVFLRIGNKNGVSGSLDCTDSPPYKKFDNYEALIVPTVKGAYLYLYQMWALLIKKWIFFQRTYRAFLIYSVLPALLVLATFFNTRPQPNQPVVVSGSTYLPVSMSLYCPFPVLYSNFYSNTIKKDFEDFIISLNCSVQEVPDIKEAIYKHFKDDFHTYAKKINLAVNFSSEGITILHNEDASHMLPVALNLIHNFLLISNNLNGSIKTGINIEHANKEVFFIPRRTPKCSIDSIPDFSGSQTMFYLLAPMQELFHGSKELQLMMTPASLYWLSHLLFDITSFIVYMIIVCVGIGFSQNDNFMLNNADEIFISLLLWGAGLILITYTVSTFVRDLAAAFSVNVLIYVVFTFVIYSAVSLEGLPNFFQYLHPTCILKFGYSDLCVDKSSYYILALFLFDVVLFGFLVVKDSKLLSQCLHWLINRWVQVDYSLENPKDELVKDEEEKVRKYVQQSNIGHALIVDQLKRWYFKGCKASPAVRGISFAINQGECFGLLGVNGAGKTSTFRMLIGAIPPSHGNIYIDENKLTFFNRRKYLFKIGYCPQLEGLIPVFRGRELLKFFARLRGLRKSQINLEARKWLEKLDLLEFADRKCGTYSGGNQRKLSTAIALIGECPVVFLDEPTSGVDPLSRRSLWNAINTVQKEGQSVVLTSHSMDECEALCSRLAIMVNGTFRCIGETTTLKDRYGQGYCIQLKISNGVGEEVLHSLKKAVTESFDNNCELIDEHLTILQYHITNKSITWAQLFTKLKVLKDTFDILESYTASATTLEQIFIHFARSQLEEETC